MPKRDDGKRVVLIRGVGFRYINPYTCASGASGDNQPTGETAPVGTNFNDIYFMVGAEYVFTDKDGTNFTCERRQQLADAAALKYFTRIQALFEMASPRNETIETMFTDPANARFENLSAEDRYIVLDVLRNSDTYTTDQKRAIEDNLKYSFKGNAESLAQILIAEYGLVAPLTGSFRQKTSQIALSYADEVFLATRAANTKAVFEYAVKNSGDVFSKTTSWVQFANAIDDAIFLGVAAP